MAKRSKPTEQPRELVPEKKPEPVNVPPPLPAGLQHLRDGALQRYSQTTETIAQLEAWRYEIDATIAFLKAQRNKPTEQKE